MQLLVPHWLGMEVLGKLLSLQTPWALSHYWGHYTKEDIQSLVPNSNVEELLQILDAVDTCARDLSNKSVVVIPALIKTRPALLLDRRGGRGEDLQKCAHYAIEKPSPFLCGIFHKVQVNLWGWLPQQIAPSKTKASPYG